MGEYAGKLHYGEQVIEGFMPKTVMDQGRVIKLTLPKGLPEIKDVGKALDSAISKSQTPAKVPDLKTILKKHYKGGIVSIIVDDHARPNVHTRMLLPSLLKSLHALGVKKENLRFLISHGTHRACKPEEYPRIFGDDVWRDYKDFVEDHDCVKGVETVGELEDGIPIELNRTALASEILIGLSDMDYHYFAGLGGGPKQIIPGIAGKNTITLEHLKMFGKVGFHENSRMGVLDGNPVFECKKRLVTAFQEAMRAKGSWFYAIVTVMNSKDKLVHIEGGEVLETHRRAETVLAKERVASIPRAADVVIISTHHVGIDLYQAGKAFNAARYAVKKGGKIVVLAPLVDGWGSEEFKGLMSLASPIINETKERLKTAGPKEKSRIASEGIKKALLSVQEVVMKDFKIGKQKPVDMFAILGHCGWDNLLLVQDGLTTADEALLPIVFIGTRGESPEKRLRDWIVRLEDDSGGKLTYCLVDDPTLLIHVKQ